MPRYCLLPGLLLCVCAAASANEKVYQRAVRGTVMISNGGGRGSGALIDKEKRLVLTAQHVAGGQSTVEVLFPAFTPTGQVITDARQYGSLRTQVRGRVVHTDSGRDIALIQVDSIPEGVEAIPLARSSPRPGQDIHCIGNAAFRSGGLFGYSYGKVRNVFRRQVGGQLNGKMVVETQVPTNKGDSGGPIVNDDGELVAIVSQGTTGVAPPQNDPFHEMQVVDHSVDISEIRAAIAGVGRPKNTLVRLNGALQRGDLMLSNRYTKVHPVRLEVGAVYIINARSQQFDTLLKVEDKQGKFLAQDDDGGDGTNSRLEFAPPASGEYRLIITTYAPQATGSYSLEVEQ